MHTRRMPCERERQISVICVKSRPINNCQETTIKCERSMEWIIPHSHQMEPTMPTPGSWISRFQNYELMHICCSSHPICGTFSLKPWKINKCSCISVLFCLFYLFTLLSKKIHGQKKKLLLTLLYPINVVLIEDGSMCHLPHD